MCKRCAAVVDNFTANVRGQVVGKCGGCGKWGNLDTGEEQSGEVEQSGGGAVSSKKTGTSAHKESRGAARRCAGRRRGSVQPGRDVHGTKETGTGAGAGTGEKSAGRFFGEDIARSIKWLLG